MENIHRVTYALVALVLVSAIFSVARTHSRNEPTGANCQQLPKSALQRHEGSKKAYPIADYDEAEPSDPDKRTARKQTQRRHNKFIWAVKNPHPETAEVVSMPEGLFDFAALPVTESDVIILGDVLAAEAHLSEDKTNVYSEFTIRVNTVFKRINSTALADKSIITIERVGGFVRYPNGRKLLYRTASSGMPRVGGRYLLFLTAIAQSLDYTILTGYELGEKNVSPLDSSPQFEALRDIQTSELLGRLVDSLERPAARSSDVPHN